MKRTIISPIILFILMFSSCIKHEKQKKVTWYINNISSKSFNLYVYTNGNLDSSCSTDYTKKICESFTSMENKQILSIQPIEGQPVSFPTYLRINYDSVIIVNQNGFKVKFAKQNDIINSNNLLYDQNWKTSETKGEYIYTFTFTEQDYLDAQK